MNRELKDILAAVREGEASQTQLQRLDEIMKEDVQARQYVIQYMHLVAALQWNVAGVADEATPAAVSAGKAPADAAVAVPASRWERAKRFFTRPTPASITVATVATLLLIVSLALIAVPAYRDAWGFGPVAQIDRAIGVNWADESTTDIVGAGLSAGDRIAIHSGIVEVAFTGGARVRLRGPASLRVDSAGSGTLDFGHVTAEAAGTAAGFEIRAPRAQVIDLGTVFALRARKSGESEVHVYEGAVEAAFLDEQGTVRRRMRLSAGQAVEWSPRQQQASQQPASEAAFVAEMDQWRTLDLHHTGRDLRAGSADPHWQIAAAEGLANFAPRAAAVTVPDPSYIRPTADSQWVSTAGNSPDLPGNAVLTFATTFELSADEVSTARIAGRFAADNTLEAIRLNGRLQPVASHGREGFRAFHRFAVESGFVAGTNRLEFVVSNLGPVASPLGLRVELQGVAHSRRTDEPAAGE